MDQATQSLQAFFNALVIKYPWLNMVLVTLGTLVVVGQFWVMHYASAALRDKVLAWESNKFVGWIFLGLSSFAPFTPKTPAPSPTDKPKV